MSQRKYVLDILQDTRLTCARQDKFPMEQYLKLTPDDGELLKDSVKYRQLSVFGSDPESIYTGSTETSLGCRNSSPKVSPGQGLLLSSKNNLTLTAYCGSDWGGCQTTPRSVSGYFIFLGSSIIS